MVRETWQALGPYFSWKSKKHSSKKCQQIMNRPHTQVIESKRGTENIAKLNNNWDTNVQGLSQTVVKRERTEIAWSTTSDKKVQFPVPTASIPAFPTRDLEASHFLEGNLPWRCHRVSADWRVVGNMDNSRS